MKRVTAIVMLFALLAGLFSGCARKPVWRIESGDGVIRATPTVTLDSGDEKTNITTYGFSATANSSRSHSARKQGHGNT